MRQIRHKDFIRLYGNGSTEFVVVILPGVGEKECPAEDVKAGDIVELPVKDGKDGSDFAQFRVLPDLSTPTAAVESLLAENSYDVTQRNGVMFSIASDLPPEAFVKAEMNIGAGPAKIWLRGDNRVLVYDIDDPRMVAKFGKPNGPIPVEPPGSIRGDYDKVYGAGRHDKDMAALKSTTRDDSAEAERLYDQAQAEHADWWSGTPDDDEDGAISEFADKLLDKFIDTYGIEAGSNLADLVYEHIFAGLT